MTSPRECSLAEVPTHDGKLPKYPYVLLSSDGSTWDASTANEGEGLDAFHRMVEMGESAGILHIWH